MKLLLGLAILAAIWAQQPGHTTAYYGTIPDTLVVRPGDTVVVRFAVPLTTTPGRYWLHAHGPNTITQLPYRRVLVVQP